ncbi:MAG: DUF255 domain-containing protein [Candidatus Obscuribacterales bacterium]|nr:DUF255 domain-containing protein [Candidatus Obscuribacterales bacterium]
MIRRFWLVALALQMVVLFAGLITHGQAKQTLLVSGSNWETWSDSVFDRAKKENRLVILDLEAGWCHWCHVMDDKTYKNPEVLKVLKNRFITVRVDQDARPDLSTRYEDYGWPATIIFDAQGRELVKKSGYINPEEMLALLNEVVSNPKPIEEKKSDAAATSTTDSGLPADLRKELNDKHVAGYDTKAGGWKTEQKFLDWDSVEYSLAQSKERDYHPEERARATLANELQLMDPVWGGVYQYSTQGDWNHPHFEKLVQFQAENMRIYALAYEYWQDPEHLKAAQDIHRYMKEFLMSPEGAFYVSQDADLVPGESGQGFFQLSDERRREMGIPHIDKHIYSRENGWVISALTQLYAATADQTYLGEAEKAAKWIIANRSIPNGGFSHDKTDPSGPYLGDTLSMGRAFLNLYAVTADRSWLKYSEDAAKFIAKTFAGKNGFVSNVNKDPQAKLVPQANLDENISVVRFANLLFHYTGNNEFKQMADSSMRYLSMPEIARKRRVLVAGILLADREITTIPTHITVVGAKQDPKARELFAAALRYPSNYKRTEWADATEGKLPNTDVEYPQLKKAAAFGCANNRCSAPAYDPEALAAIIDQLSN